MFQLKVANLQLTRLRMDERQLRKQLFQAFTRYGKCSVYVDAPMRNDDTRDAYVTFWNLQHAKTARREMEDRSFHSRRLDITLLPKPRIFGAESNWQRNGNFSPLGGRPAQQRMDGGNSGPVDKQGAMPFRTAQAQADSVPATRTLYVGNLPPGVSAGELKAHFSGAGDIYDLQIKRAHMGPDYAFIKFQHMRDARRAKLELQGSLLQKCRLRMNFSKGTPSNRIYVYNLGRWATQPVLERCFERFGVMRAFDYRPGSAFAIVEYEQQDSARKAMQDQVRVLAENVEHPVAVSFVDAMDLTVNFQGERGRSGNWDAAAGNAMVGGNSGSAADQDRRSASRSREFGQMPERDYWHSDERTNRKRSHSADERQEAATKRQFSGVAESDGAIGGGDGGESLADIAARCAVMWRGCLVLRDACCPIRLHSVDESPGLAEGVLSCLEVPRITLSKKMPLDPARLDELLKTVHVSNHSWLLALPTGTSDTDELRAQLAVVDKAVRKTSVEPYMGSNDTGSIVSPQSDKMGADDDNRAAGLASTDIAMDTGENTLDAEPGNILLSKQNDRTSPTPAVGSGCDAGEERCLASGPTNPTPTSMPADYLAAPELQWRHMKNFANYMRAKQCAGVAQLDLSLPGGASLCQELGATHGTALLHAFPPSDFTDQQLADLCPGLATPLDGVMLVLLLVPSLTATSPVT
ncbi:uncharacterized protein LOC135816921 [Sycon ciliatum]|uniref:uncharacterized protein LOC135816921 n=1 Tax=Sycon ciliatum TaxID=27933 RepID=UPI0031F62064